MAKSSKQSQRDKLPKISQQAKSSTKQNDQDAARALLPRPVHKVARVSLLSSDETHENENISYRGFINLGVLILLATNAKDIIKNLRLGGSKTDIFFASLATMQWSVPDHTDMLRWPVLYTLVMMCSMACVAVWIEQIAAKYATAELQTKQTRISKAIPYLHTLNCILSIAVPATLVLVLHPSVAGSVVIMMSSVTLNMKLISYTMVNSALRAHYIVSTSLAAAKQNKDKQQQVDDSTSYPNNLTLKNMGMFFAFPTLVYQTSYPRSERVRPMYVIRRLIEMFFGASLIMVIVTEYIAPGAQKAMVPMNEMDILYGIERVFALAVPNIYVWLLGFYAFFHVYLNLIAELTRFADRRFYDDWWNSVDVGMFWQKWNIPIGGFLKTHIYVPLAIHRGWSKPLVLAFVFFVSGVGHELIFIGVPSHAPVRVWWCLLGMVGQIPLVFLTRKLSFGSHTLGNVVFWLSIFLGQPAGLLMYYYDYSRVEIVE